MMLLLRRFARCYRPPLTHTAPAAARVTSISPHGRLLIYGVLAVHVTLAVLPLLSSGYYSDDLMTSATRGWWSLQGTTMLEYLRERMMVKGRVQPLAMLLGFSVQYLLPGPFMYKCFLLLMVVANVLLFARFVEIISGNFHSGCLAALMVPVLIQFRLYHDPVLSFSGLMQFLVALILSSLILFQQYVESGRRSRLFWSLLLFNGALYCYEVSIPFVVVFGILASGGASPRGRLSGIRKALPHFVSTACALAINGLVRFLRDPSLPVYPGIAFSRDGMAAARTFMIQLSSSLPMSYRLLDPANLFSGPGIGWIAGTDIADAAVFALAFRHLAKRAGASAQGGVLILIGGATWLLPASLIALSQKYQQDLRWGEGHLSVYIQYFGVILVAVGLLTRWRGRVASSPSGRYWGSVAGALLTSCLLVNIYDNRLVVEQANIELHYRRAALVEALRGGILAPVPEGATLVISDRYSYNPRPGVTSPLRGWSRGYPWKNTALVLQFSGKRLRVVDGDAGMPDLAAANDSRSTFLLEIRSFPERLKEKTGYVVLSQAIRIDAGPGAKARRSPCGAAAGARWEGLQDHGAPASGSSGNRNGLGS